MLNTSNLIQKIYKQSKLIHSKLLIGVSHLDISKNLPIYDCKYLLVQELPPLICIEEQGALWHYNLTEYSRPTILLKMW